MKCSKRNLKRHVAKKQETITIPIELARLLTAEPEDLKEGTSYDDVQKLAKSLLKLLMVTIK